MPRIFIHRDLVARIEQYGFGMQLKGFISAIQEGQHPPRIYKASGIRPKFEPYAELELHHHHLHRDGDPLLITQHVDGDIYGVALATHKTYFQEDKMQWLKDNADAIDWSLCTHIHRNIMNYDPAAPETEQKDEPIKHSPSPPDDDIPF